MTASSRATKIRTYEIDPSEIGPSRGPRARSLPGRHFGTRTELTARLHDREPDDPHAAPCPLSVRAVNVLKLLAPEIVGEVPPRGAWTPPDALLRRITVETLRTARNCGPRTVAEILSWAQSRGVAIRPLFHAGKSLAATWRDLDVRSATGQVVKAEIVEALERSVRRKNRRIPITVQRLVLAMLSPARD
jgi:hypothetical protein